MVIVDVQSARYSRSTCALAMAIDASKRMQARATSGVRGGLLCCTQLRPPSCDPLKRRLCLFVRRLPVSYHNWSPGLRLCTSHVATAAGLQNCNAWCSTIRGQAPICGWVAASSVCLCSGWMVLRFGVGRSVWSCVADSSSGALADFAVYLELTYNWLIVCPRLDAVFRTLFCQHPRACADHDTRRNDKSQPPGGAHCFRNSPWP